MNNIYDKFLNIKNDQFIAVKFHYIINLKSIINSLVEYKYQI
jgi:hypothetical protein